MQTAIALVAVGAGVSLIPLAVARAQTGRDIACVSLAAPSVIARLSVVWRDDDVSPALQHLMDVVDTRWGGGPEPDPAS